jgi:quinohemoprotein ethanol dehydrogenase
VGVHIHKGKPQPGLFYIGGLSISGVLADPQDGKGALIAWDPVAQKARWRVQQSSLWNGGVLSTAGDLVFQGTGDGIFIAYDARSGEPLWRFNAGLGIIGAPIGYTVAGREYISILVGYGGATAIWNQLMPRGWKYGAQPRRLLTFSLGGKARLPPTAPRSDSLQALDDPAVVIDTADAAAGQALFNLACSACHGLNLASPGAPGPDLRESRIALSESGVFAAVHDGALLEKGMPQFAMLGSHEIHEIYAYIRAGARAALATGNAAATRNPPAGGGVAPTP